MFINFRKVANETMHELQQIKPVLEAVYKQLSQPRSHPNSSYFIKVLQAMEDGVHKGTDAIEQLKQSLALVQSFLNRGSQQDTPEGEESI